MIRAQDDNVIRMFFWEWDNDYVEISGAYTTWTSVPRHFYSTIPPTRGWTITTDRPMPRYHLERDWTTAILVEDEDEEIPEEFYFLYGDDENKKRKIQQSSTRVCVSIYSWK